MYKFSAGKNNSPFMLKDFKIRTGQVDSTFTANHFAAMFEKYRK